MKGFRGIKVLMALAVALCTSLVANAQEKNGLKYVDALEFQIINKGFENTYSPYTRLPLNVEDSVKRLDRGALLDRGRNSAGMGIRFSSNSARIGIRYNLTWNFHMAHMADTGIKGTDLYILNDEGVWEYVNTNRPYLKDSVQTKIYADALPTDRMREYIIYLPLYDGINWMEIGVDSSAVIEKPLLNNPRKEKKVVFYGTSILQGGCATRTGMVATNMIQRDLNVECVNLGFSGEGKMDMFMAEAMATIPDVVAYVLDPIPNCTKDMCTNLTYDFVKKLRDERPGIPIIMVEGPMYSYTKYDKFTKNYLAEKNAEWRKNYEKLKADNPDNLFYVTAEGLSGNDNEGTVDGIHFTDMGFRAYANKLIPILKEIVK